MKLDMLNNEFKGKLISFCGLTSCGENKYIELLTKCLEEKGYKVYLTKQLNEYVTENDVFGTFIDWQNLNEYNDTISLLFCISDCIQNINSIISHKLKEGYVVISDKYFYFYLASLIAEGIEEEKIYEIAKPIIKPDISFFLNLPVDEAIARMKKEHNGRENDIDVEFQKKLHDIYIDLAKKNNGIIVSTLLPENSCYKRIEFEVTKNIIWK